jgi:2',3'-cyclic-nucleotide 2'-phosphodiesterase (5'-nucleotidase family)
LLSLNRSFCRYAHLTTLTKSCNFPWLLSNIVDSRTGKQPQGLEKFVVFERRGVKIGILGLVEQ